MNSSRDNWDRLMVAVLRREQFRQLALSHSRSPSTSSLDTENGFISTSPLDQMSIGSSTTSPSHRAIVAANGVREKKLKEAAKRRAEIERIRELYTFKGKLDAAIRLKGLDTDKDQGYYTV